MLQLYIKHLEAFYSVSGLRLTTMPHLHSKFSGEQRAQLLKGLALLFPASLLRRERWVISLWFNTSAPTMDTASDDENGKMLQWVIWAASLHTGTQPPFFQPLSVEDLKFSLVAVPCCRPFGHANLFVQCFQMGFFVVYTFCICFQLKKFDATISIH